MKSEMPSEVCLYRDLISVRLEVYAEGSRALFLASIHGP